jgi:signal peptidase complex subunit 3
MYSLSGRLNAIAFNTLVVLAILSTLNYFSVFFDKKTPNIIKNFKVKDYETFVKDNYFYEDCMSFDFDFHADMTPLFNWNTNIIFAYISCEFNTTKSTYNKITIWDKRIPRQDLQEYSINLQGEFVEYYLTDINKLLRDTEVTCYLNWE